MRITLALLFFGTVVGCGGNIAESTNNTGGGGSGQSSGTSGTTVGSGEGGTTGTAGTGTTGAVGMGGSVGTAGGTGVGDGDGGVVTGSPGSCAATNDHASFRVHGAPVKTPSGTQSCETTDRDAGITPMMVEGAVTEVTPTSFTIDLCLSIAHCVDSLLTFEVTAPGLKIPIPVGSFVQVEYLTINIQGCYQSLEVQSIPEWGGIQNPTGLGRNLLLAISDGGWSNFEDSPYTVDHALLPLCSVDAGRACNSTPAGTFSLRFGTKNPPIEPVEVRMGETKMAPLQSPKGIGTVMVRNLRSYQTTLCDDYSNWAYYMYWQPPSR